MNHSTVIEGWGDGTDTRAKFGFTCPDCGRSWSSLSETAIHDFFRRHTATHKQEPA